MAKVKAKRSSRSPVQPAALGDRLARLAAAIDDVRSGRRVSARTIKLLESGAAKMAQKVIEEAAEVGIDAARGERKAVVRESVDLLYNLTVLWTAMDITLSDVWAEMDRREKLLGFSEKLPKVTPADDDA